MLGGKSVPLTVQPSTLLCSGSQAVASGSGLGGVPAVVDVRPSQEIPGPGPPLLTITSLPESAPLSWGSAPPAST